MSQLGPLLARLKESGAERIFFAPNEDGYVLDGDVKKPMPGGPVKAAILLAAISELLSQDDISGLSNSRPRIVRHEHDGEDFVLEIVRHVNGVALGIRQSARAGRPLRDHLRREEPGRTEPAKRTRSRRIPLELEPGSRVASPPAQEQPMATDELLNLVRQIAREAGKEAAYGALAASKSVHAQQPSVDPTGSSPVDPHVVEAAVAPAQPAAHHGQGPAKIDTLLKEMLQKKASDLHLTSNAHPVLRVDGEIHFGTDHHRLSSSDIIMMVEEIMTLRARHDFKSHNDADFAYELPGHARFRVNVFQDRHGTGAVLRQIPIEIVSAEKLGLPKACLDLCWLSKGLVLVTGPTGSGKSTTLAAMVDFINRNRCDHIITIEDPVEFVHENQKCLVNQREVGQHTESFKNALRAALREDPDIVLVGEMRDLETISIAIETAETGHLVFGTLHTTTAISTVDRIIDQFPTDRQEQIRVMLSESLKGVVAQVLCPKIGGGRVAAHEILLGTTAVAAMIREGKTFQLTSTMQTSKGQGMVTMNDSLLSLVQKKFVDPKQAYIKAVDKSGFVAMLRAAGITPPV